MCRGWYSLCGLFVVTNAWQLQSSSDGLRVMWTWDAQEPRPVEVGVGSCVLSMPPAAYPFWLTSPSCSMDWTPLCRGAHQLVLQAHHAEQVLFIMNFSDTSQLWLQDVGDGLWAELDDQVQVLLWPTDSPEVLTPHRFAFSWSADKRRLTIQVDTLPTPLQFRTASPLRCTAGQANIHVWSATSLENPPHPFVASCRLQKPVLPQTPVGVPQLPLYRDTRGLWSVDGNSLDTTLHLSLMDLRLCANESMDSLVATVTPVELWTWITYRDSPPGCFLWEWVPLQPQPPRLTPQSWIHCSDGHG